MALTKTELSDLLRAPQFPRSAHYDPQWIIKNEMGPNALWLTEWLCQALDLRPGMRVLDMGCGNALSSIFLAKEFGVQVWATDLWIKPTDNFTRIREAGLADRIYPIHAEARALPYADGFFDAIVCVDSYIYYGTDDLYLQYFARFVRPGGQIGIVIPGLMKEFDGPLPEHLVPFWGNDRWHQDCWSWHTATWWRRLWERSGLMQIEIADTMPDGWRMYLQWKQTLSAAGVNKWPHDIDVLKADSGRYIGFVRLVGRLREGLGKP